eukprot:4479626-Pleurochrysis_carterae.AAC.1
MNGWTGKLAPSTGTLGRLAAIADIHGDVAHLRDNRGTAMGARRNEHARPRGKRTVSALEWHAR